MVGVGCSVFSLVILDGYLQVKFKAQKSCMELLYCLSCSVFISIALQDLRVGVVMLGSDCPVSKGEI